MSLAAASCFHVIVWKGEEGFPSLSDILLFLPVCFQMRGRFGTDGISSMHESVCFFDESNLK